MTETLVKVFEALVVIFLEVIMVMLIGRVICLRKIKKAVKQGDMVKYEKMLNSKWYARFVGSDRINLLKAVFYSNKNDYSTALAALAQIDMNQLDEDEKEIFIQVSTSIAIATHHKELFNQLGGVIDEYSKKLSEEKAEELKHEYELNRKLYFKFDPSIIPELEANVEKAEDDKAKGMNEMMLAKAYHLNKDDKKATAALKEAKSLLAGTPYEETIKEMIKKPSLLDN